MAKARDCTPLMAGIAAIAKHHTDQNPSMSFDDVVTAVQSHFSGDDKPRIPREIIAESMLANDRAIEKKVRDTAKKRAKDTGQKDIADKIDSIVKNTPADPATPGEHKRVAKANKSLGEVNATLDKQLAGTENTDADRAAKIIASIGERFDEGGDAASINRLAQMLAKELVMGTTNRDQLIDAVHEAIKENAPPGWTRRNTMDAISGYGDFKPLSKEAAAVKLREYKGEMQQVAKLEDMEQKLQAPLKTGLERRAPSDEERRLIQQVNDTMKRLNIQTTDPATQLRSKLDAIKTRLTHSIADTELQIQLGERVKREVKAVPRDDEANRLQQQYDDLRKKLDELVGPDVEKRRQILQERIAKVEAKLAANDLSTGREPKAAGPKEQLEARLDSLNQEMRELRADDARMKSLKEQKAKLENELATGQYEQVTPGEKPPERSQALSLVQGQVKKLVRLRNLKRSIADLRNQLASGNPRMAARRAAESDEITKLKVEQGILLSRRNRMIDNLRPKTPMEKAINAVASLRTLKASGDFPPLFRQGWVGSILHPIMGSKALGAGIRTMFDKHYAAKLDIEMREHPDFWKIERAGTFFSPIEGGSMNEREEELMGTLADKLPWVAAGSRGYNTFLNQLSFQIMKSTVDYLDPTLPNYDQVLSEVAHRINDYRGRAAVGKKGGNAERAVTAAGGVFFSLRNWVSRAKMASLYHVWKPGSWEARKLAIADTAKFYGAMVVLHGLLKLLGGEAEEDPRSGAFGKVRFGDQTIDYTGQIGTELNFLTRMIFGQTKTSTGKIVPTYGFDYATGDKGLAQVARKVRSKLSPVVGFLVDLATRSDYSGDPVNTPGSIAAHTASQFVPMAWGDIAKAYWRNDAGSATAFTVLTMLGAGQQDANDFKSIDQRRKAARKEMERDYPRKRKASGFKL